MAKQYETVIGLEVHVELATKTKIFCGCSTAFGGAPNTHVCPVCSGMPGSLPVLNKQVLKYAVAVGMAMNCDITRYAKFDRKNLATHRSTQTISPLAKSSSEYRGWMHFWRQVLSILERGMLVKRKKKIK